MELRWPNASASVAVDRAGQGLAFEYNGDTRSRIVSVNLPELGATWVNRRHVET